MSKFHVTLGNDIDHESIFQPGIDIELNCPCIVNTNNGWTSFYNDEKHMIKVLSTLRKRPELAEVLGWCKLRQYKLVENKNEQV